MKLERRVSGGYVRMAAVSLMLAALCFWNVYFPVSAANEKVISATVDAENVYLYVKGVSDITGGSVQIGNIPCENVAVSGLDAFQTPLRTVILLDNSHSIKADKRADILAILKAVVDGRMEREEFRIGTFSDSVVWLCDYSTEYDTLQGILDALEYVNQQTYFSDCLYGVIEEMSDAQDTTYSRIIIVSDGADNQAIGYTNQEVSDLLGKRSIPVYAIGTMGDNSALETMFSFSRASKADYYLLDGSVSNDDIVTSLLEDHQISCLRITPDAALLDGSQRSIRATLQTSAGEVVVTASVDMPFASGIPVVEATPEPTPEPQEEATPEPREESTPEPTAAPKETPEPTEGEGTEGGSPDNLSGGSLADVPIRFIVIAGVVLSIILMVVIILIVAGRKKARRKAYKEQQSRGGVTDKTLIRGDENAGDDNTMFQTTLWDQAQARNTYLVLRDNARPASMHKVLIRDVIRIGRKDADIVIDYDKYISAKQCEIIKRGALLYIKDLGSANGTYYENVRVYDQETPIVSGGTIQIGQSTFTITIVTE